MEKEVKITPAVARKILNIYEPIFDVQEKKIKEALDAYEKKTEEAFVEHSDSKESPRDLEELIKSCAEKHGKILNKQQLKNYADSFLKLANILGDDEIPVDAVKRTLADKVNAVEHYAQSARSRLDLDFSNTKEKLNKQDKRIKEMERRISAAEESHIPITDQRAKDMLALQVELLSNYSRFGADANVAARCTSYGLWAYLQSSNGTTITPMPAEEVEQ